MNLLLPYYLETYRGADAAKRDIPGSIDKLFKREEAKHGKKLIEYNIIKALQNKSDVLKYAGIALGRSMSTPVKWTVKDIESTLGIADDKIDIPEKFKNYIAHGSDKNLSEIQKKSYGNEIAKYLIAHEADSTAAKADAYKLEAKIAGVKETKSTLASQLNKRGKNTQIESAILSGIQFLQNVKRDHNDYTFDASKLLNYSPESNESPTVFINDLIRKIKTELKSLKTKYNLDKKVEEHINAIVNSLSDIPHHILWPEPSHKIDSQGALSKYFKGLRSNEEQKRGEKVLKNISKERQEQFNKSSDEHKMNVLIADATKKLEGLQRYNDDFDEELTKLTKLAIRQHSWIKNYLITNKDVPKDAEDYEIEDELKSILYSGVLKERKGRPYESTRKEKK